MWIGTDFGGLNLFDRDTESFYRIQHDPDNPTAYLNSVRSIVEDKAGNLWLGTTGGGLSKLVLNPEDVKKERSEVFDFGGNTFTNFRYNPADSNSLSQRFSSISFIDDDGIVWLVLLAAV